MNKIDSVPKYAVVLVEDHGRAGGGVLLHLDDNDRSAALPCHVARLAEGHEVSLTLVIFFLLDFLSGQVYLMLLSH